MGKQFEVKWRCIKCGCCCELLQRGCQYRKRNGECRIYDNRPWPCRKNLLLGDAVAIDQCNLLRALSKWRAEAYDKERCDRVIQSIVDGKFGATEEEQERIKEFYKDRLCKKD